jgi:hypothetical protein
MFFTRVGLEQSTDEWIARYKARRFTTHRVGPSPVGSSHSPPLIADLCCGIGGDLMGIAAEGAAVGIERNPVTAHFAAANSGVRVEIADASSFDLSSVDAWHMDPDRRTGGRRTTSLDYCEPDSGSIELMLAKLPHAAIKLAPATQTPAHWKTRCELEWISRDRECRQLVAWHGDLAQSPGYHRATIISSGSNQSAPAGTLVGQPDEPIPVADKPQRYIFDTDPAVRAARLHGALAAEKKLQAIGPGPSYLTGSTPIVDPMLSCFENHELLPLRAATLGKHLRKLGIGQLEIKKRGLDVDPEKLRLDLKLRGNNRASLLITRIDGRPTAILARRVAS